MVEFNPLDYGGRVPREAITPEIFHLTLKCDAEAGKLYWRERPREWFNRAQHWKIWNKRYAGEMVSNVINSGYIRLSLFAVSFTAHRVIWGDGSQ